MVDHTNEDQKSNPPAGCFLRLFWMMVGNMILLFCVFGIIQHRSSVFSIADVSYWVAVGSILAARYVDIRYFHGTKADGDPATLAHWRRYAIALGMVSAGLWFGVHAIAYYGT